MTQGTGEDAPGLGINNSFGIYEGVERMSKVASLPIDVIKIDGKTQPREKINQETVQEYRERIDAGDKFPPVVVYFDGASHWLADGFHRYHAFRHAAKTDIMCEIVKGTLAEAQWYAAGANKTHGIRRTKKDVIHALRMAYKAKAGITDVELAKQVGVGRDTVRDWRKADGIDNPHSAHATRGVTCKSQTEAKSLQDNDRVSEAEAFITEKKAENFPDDRILLIAATRGSAFRAEVEKLLKGEDAGPPMDAEETEESPEPKKAPEPMKDKVGNVLPNHLVGDFQRTDEIQARMTALSKMKQEVGNLVKKDDPLYRGLNWQRFEADMEQAYNALRHAKPYAVCPYCWAKDVKGCQACKGRGWVGEGVYKAAPRENK